ncbi:transcriptional regulator [Streptomyces sp. NPDC005794]|uniref:transcriptional regulator n=1 Tax=Streptomyces sp. NPDC005794 TaxID=3364733 RepID=UPI0036AC6B11
MLKFSPPPKAAENAEFIARRLKEAVEGEGPRESVTVEWNGRPLHVGVIDMPLRDVYYNPATHRIRAQRDHDPALATTLESDPWLDESQEYLNRLLVGKPTSPEDPDPDFMDLMTSLGEVDQQEPGLITHEGILVNGNTRAAALRKLGKTSIRVGVLPPSFTWEDINAVELALQLRPDERRDYSYINRLLAMEEQELLGRAAVDISREFHILPKTFRQERWILGVIREMIDRSRTEDGSQLSLTDFEGHQENLKELHKNYTKEEASSQEIAEQVKENRIAAIILDFAKTKTRLINGKFQQNYLTGAIPNGFERDSLHAGAAIPIAGLSVSVTPPSLSVMQARAITDEILQAQAMSSARHAPMEARETAQHTLSSMKKAMRRALDEADRDDRLKKVQQTTAERLDDASAAINQSVSDLARAFANSSLDEESFDSALLRLKDSLLKLARQANRGIIEPGAGMEWLIKASEDRT